MKTEHMGPGQTSSILLLPWVNAEAAPRQHVHGETGLRESANRAMMLQAVTQH